MTTAILIPARYKSSRFPGKMLADLYGKTLIERVFEKCVETGFDTYVLTDHEEISSKFDPSNVIIQCENLNIKNGTERCKFAAINDSRLFAYNKFINVQGDMPDITPEIIISVRRLLRDFDVSTAYTDLNEELKLDKNTVKAIVYENELEWCGRGFTSGYQHLGVYGYSEYALKNYPEKETSAEIRSNLEQLRWLENDWRIGITKVNFNGIEINTPEDAKKWEMRYRIKNVNKKFDYRSE
jgi:3-deoxy-manno-octulosonate cytidylyltransferase (CMP-KDO synthetase)